MWRVQKPDGSVYGPAPLEVLRRWAAEGRIAADDQVAEEGGDWRPAPSVAALEMEWLLMQDGEAAIGPLHILAFAELLQDGALIGQEFLVHAAGGEPAPIACVIARECLRRLSERSANTELPASQGRSENAQAGAKLPAVAAAEGAGGRSAPEDARALPDRIAALERELSDVRAEAESLRTRAREEGTRAALLEEELRLAREEIRRLHILAEVSARTAATASADKVASAAHERDIRDLTKRCERLLAQVDEQMQRSESLEKELAAERKAAESRQAEFEKQIEQLKTELQNARRQLDQKNDDFRFLVTQHRELNERFIRLKQEFDNIRGAGEKPKVRLA